MRTIVLSLALAAFTFTGYAQNHGTPQPTQHDYARTTTDKMAKDLSLNDDQRKRVNDLNTTRFNEQQNLQRANANDAKMKEHREKAQKDYDKQMRSILNEDQMKRYEERKDQYTFEHGNVERNATRSGQGSSTQPNKK